MGGSGRPDCRVPISMMNKNNFLQISYNIGSKYAGSYKNIFKSLAYKMFYKNIEKNMILLNTIPKSGTNRLKLFLANYIHILDHPESNTTITYDDMMRDYFPNLRDQYTAGGIAYKNPIPSVMTKYGYSDFTHCHSTRFIEFFPGKIVFLYRNPMDQVISLFYYRYKYRSIRSDTFSHPREVMEYILRDYARHYLALEEVGSSRPILKLTYEDMIHHPEQVFGRALEWWGLPVSANAISQATQRSDIKVVRKFEQNHGPIHSPSNFKGTFTRSGAIGQWKSVFSNEDISLARRILSEEGLDYSALMRDAYPLNFENS